MTAGFLALSDLAVEPGTQRRQLSVWFTNLYLPSWDVQALYLPYAASTI